MISRIIPRPSTVVKNEIALQGIFFRFFPQFLLLLGHETGVGDAHVVVVVQDFTVNRKKFRPHLMDSRGVRQEARPAAIQPIRGLKCGTRETRIL